MFFSYREKYFQLKFSFAIQVSNPIHNRRGNVRTAGKIVKYTYPKGDSETDSEPFSGNSDVDPAYTDNEHSEDSEMSMSGDDISEDEITEISVIFHFLLDKLNIICAWTN